VTAVVGLFLLGAVQPTLLAFAAVSTVAALALAYATLHAPRAGPRESRRYGFRERRGRTARRAADPRQALALVGNALAATHDPTALLPVIVDVVAEATGARGATLLDGGVERLSVGDVDESRPSTTFDLGESLAGEPVTLVLYPADERFDDETVSLAAWLASQAAVAFENARLHHTVQRQAVTDELTGLANRRRFMDALTAEIARSRAHGTPVSVVLADLDDFKQVNDDTGHHMGDAVLRVFAQVVSEHLREVDVPGRLGGEEFAIILPDTDLDGAASVADRIRSAVPEGTAAIPGLGRGVTASFGVAELGETQSVDDLLRFADVALYRAKRAGKNCVAREPPRE
jgi:diguanylate cyclase (GGDEF)-like protein